MYLLQAGVDIAVIATHGYVEADLRMKESGLDKLTPAQGRPGPFNPKDDLLRFLSAL